MKYKAYFHYEVWENGTKTIAGRDVPIDSFRVIGGAYREIENRSTDDVSISSELEQARFFKNINLYLPSAKDHTIMKATWDLAKIAFNKLGVGLKVEIEKYFRGKLLEALQLLDVARLKKPLYLDSRNLLVAEFVLPSAILSHGKDHGKGQWKIKDM